MQKRFDLILNENAGADYEILEIIGEMDSMNLRDNRNKILDIINKNLKKNFVLNLLNMDFINSESISFFLQMESELNKKGQSLVIINAKKNVQDVLNVIGIFETIKYYANLSEFLKNK
jgi:anti-anti-sigma factor